MAASRPADALLIAELQAEEKALQEFKALLATEQKAIIEGDAEGLLTLSQSKLELVERLNRHAAERLRHIVALGLNANRSSMQEWAVKTGQTALAAWDATLAAARDAQQTNQINGALIQTHLQHNQQALSALLAAANQANLYGPDGQPKNTPTGSNGPRGIIGKA